MQPAPFLTASDEIRLRLFVRARKICIIVAMLIAVTVLAAWMLPAFAQLLPDGWSLMKANTALSVLLSAVSLYTIISAQNRQGLIVLSLSLGLTLIMTLTAMTGHLLDQSSFRIETLVAADSESATPGRMSLQTALFYFTLTLALLLLWRQSAYPQRMQGMILDGICLLLILVVLVISAGYLFQITGLVGQSAGTVTSPQTLITMITLTIALTIQRMRDGLFSVFLEPGIGGSIVRTYTPLTLLLPFLIVAAILRLVDSAWLSTTYAMAWIAILTSVMLLLFMIALSSRIVRAETLLKESVQQNYLLTNFAGEGICGIDLSGRILQANPATGRLLGCPDSELIGRSLFEFAPDLDLEKPASPLHRLLQQADAEDYFSITTDNETFYRRDGTSLAVELTCSLIRQDHHPAGFVMIFSDISERRKIEKMKDEFVSTVSHELRTPITSIKGALGLITGGTMGEMPKQCLNLATIALENSDRLATLVEDLLDINTINLAETDIPMAGLSVNKLLNTAIVSNQVYADKYGVKLIFRPNLDDSCMVIGNESRLVQVITNLLSNAIKYSPENDQVNISTRLLDDKIRVLIADHGPGIPVEYHNRVFEKFTQADSSDTRSKGGTGLGLAISLDIIRKHGGDIDFETSADGTTFYFDLPVIAQNNCA